MLRFNGRLTLSPNDAQKPGCGVPSTMHCFSYIKSSQPNPTLSPSLPNVDNSRSVSHMSNGESRLDAEREAGYKLTSTAVDDFELEARLDASRYARAQQVDTERDRIKAENRVRRRQGMTAQPLPRRARNAAPVLPCSSESDESSDNSDDPFSGPSRKRKRGRTFTYEGRKCSCI